jgi:regulator of ribonuclease activity A
MKTLNTTDLCDDFILELKVASPIGFKDYGNRKSFHGQIVTIKVLENNPLIRKTLSEPGHGKVLVVDGGNSYKCALMGDNIAKLALKNGWAGVIIYGAIRDSVEIGKLNLGVKAMHLIPIKSGKEELGEKNITLHFADIDFIPDQYVYCDEDGIVVSRRNYG